MLTHPYSGWFLTGIFSRPEWPSKNLLSSLGEKFVIILCLWFCTQNLVLQDVTGAEREQQHVAVWLLVPCHQHVCGG